VRVGLAITGSVGARLGSGPVPRAVLRNVAGGLLAMGVTYLLGNLAGGLMG
jgi:VIT1/CCC1 family predicted Fe2+/Mn2+ transporter